MAGTIYCGTAGWPKGNASRRLDSLDRLSEDFGVLEIGSSFTELLKPELTTLWARRVGSHPRFLFTAKLHRAFTHDRNLDPALVRTFKEGLRPLAARGRLGCLLMQFPWSFRFTAENRDFLIRLRRTFHEFPIAAEMRHASWSAEEALGTFIDYRIGFCNIDQPDYSKAMPASEFLTSSISYVRLHGKNCLRWFAERNAPGTGRYDYLYSEEELRRWKSRIDRIVGYAERVFVVFNNDTGPKATTNALQMQALLRGDADTGPLLSKLRRESQCELFTRYAGQAVA